MSNLDALVCNDFINFKSTFQGISNLRRLFSFILAVCVSLLVDVDGSLAGEIAKFPVTRDLWISSASGEEEGNNGGAPRLKVKGYQEFSILDFDLAPLLGKRIEKATLHLKKTGGERLYRVGVSSITSDWVEGTGSNYEKVEGTSSFRWRKYQSEPWFDRNCGSWGTPRKEYSDITSVIFGLGGSIWANSDASEPNDDWQTIDVNVDVVTARVLGLSYGFVVFDDTGTELERNGDDVNIRLFPNRFFYSKEQNKSCSPFLEIEYSDVLEKKRPQEPLHLSADSKELPRGAVKISWESGRLLTDEVLGFFMNVDGQKVQQYLLQQPNLGSVSDKSAEKQNFSVLLSGLDPNEEHLAEITTINRLGEKSKISSIKFRSSDKTFDGWERIVNSGSPSKSLKEVYDRRRGGTGVWKDVSVSIVDEFIKFTEDGKSVPTTSATYTDVNSIWNSNQHIITLSAAKNEFIGFQIVFKGTKANEACFSIKWENSNENTLLPQSKFYRFKRVETPKGQMIDPTIPVGVNESVQLQEGIDSVYCELLTPEGMESGTYKGKLYITDLKDNALELSINLNVWNFSLPNELNFLPEMNCYSLPEKEREYYRLAQVHRTYINRVPYSHRGVVGDGLAPLWNEQNKTFDWNNWEQRFGQYFDGSAFADLPRGAVPIEAFYLPLFENFPGNIFNGFKGVNTWPDSNAFTAEYCEDLKLGIKGFVRQIEERNWNKTRFLFFLNNKVDYKRNGWSHASSPWLLDEPASYRDFAALEFFGAALRDSLKEIGSDNSIKYRADISRPQWERNSLDSVLDVYVVGGDVFRKYNRIVRERSVNNKRLLYTYGTTAAPQESAYQPVFWALDAWSMGADGVVPWQTIGNEDSWRIGDELALFYPGTNECNDVVIPSLRLKAYRRGEQDVEYLTLLLKATARSRDEVAAALRARLRLDNVSGQKNSEEDAGTLLYGGVSPDELQTFRREIGALLDETFKMKEL